MSEIFGLMMLLLFQWMQMHAIGLGDKYENTAMTYLPDCHALSSMHGVANGITYEGGKNLYQITFSQSVLAPVTGISVLI